MAGALIAVVVGAGFTTRAGSSVPVLALKKVSPWYVAVMAWVPAASEAVLNVT